MATLCGYRDESGTVYHQLRADHVLQTYLPGQLCVIEGKSFRVERVVWAERCVFVSHDDTLAEPDYRTTTGLRSSPHLKNGNS